MCDAMELLDGIENPTGENRDGTWKHTPGRYTTDAPGYEVEIVDYGNGYGWFMDEYGDGRPRRLFPTAKAAMAYAEEYHMMNEVA